MTLDPRVIFVPVAGLWVLVSLAYCGCGAATRWKVEWTRVRLFCVGCDLEIYNKDVN